MAHEIPFCRCSRNNALAIATSPTETAITMESATQWTGTPMWASSPNPARITVPEPGVYLFSGFTTWVLGTQTYVWLSFWLNGSARLSSALQPVVSTPRQSISEIVNLTTGDYLELRASHNQGTNQNVNISLFSCGLLGDYRTLAA